MSKSASPTLIGAFVLGALGLGIASVAILGSGNLLHRGDSKYVLFFNGSVKGLQIGAPVMFRGVKIGQVSDIRLEFHLSDLSTSIPVEITLDRGRIKVLGGELVANDAYLSPLIKKGLKGQLQTSSIVTGQLMVYLDFFPKDPIRFAADANEKYPEIPTKPSDIQELARRFEELPLKQIAVKMDSVLTGIDRLANSPDAMGTLSSARRLTEDLDNLVERNQHLGDQTSRALEEISRASRSLNSLADYLSRHPEALIRGKKASKGE